MKWNNSLDYISEVYDSEAVSCTKWILKKGVGKKQYMLGLYNAGVKKEKYAFSMIVWIAVLSCESFIKAKSITVFMKHLTAHYFMLDEQEGPLHMLKFSNYLLFLPKRWVLHGN